MVEIHIWTFENQKIQKANIDQLKVENRHLKLENQTRVLETCFQN